MKTTPAGKRSACPSLAFQNVDGFALDLTTVQTLRFTIPDGSNKPVWLDQVRLNCPDTVTVLNTADNGTGSLRKALGTVCVGGTINFSDTLAGQTITLESGPLTLGKNVTIDASAAPGLSIRGNNASRVFEVNAGTTATVKYLTVKNGYLTTCWQGPLSMARTGPLMIHILPDKCHFCGCCVGVCPEDDIELLESRISIIDERCTNCCKCVWACPWDVIQFHREGVSHLPGERELSASLRP